MFDELIGFERMSFPDSETGELKYMGKFYVVSHGIDREGLSGDMCSCLKKIVSDENSLPAAEVGKVMVQWIPDGKGGARFGGLVNIK